MKCKRDGPNRLDSAAIQPSIDTAGKNGRVQPGTRQRRQGAGQRRADQRQGVDGLSRRLRRRHVPDVPRARRQPPGPDAVPGRAQADQRHRRVETCARRRGRHHDRRMESRRSRRLARRGHAHAGASRTTGRYGLVQREGRRLQQERRQGGAGGVSRRVTPGRDGLCGPRIRHGRME